jgi:pyridoxal phosphate enzyme (YggS family)
LEINNLCKGHKNLEFLAVTKNRDSSEVIQLIKKKFFLFGENRVQEAKKKYQLIRNDYPNISLHLIGPLQSNKTVDALQLFNCIQSIDREKIANTISNYIHEDWCLTKSFYIQVNIGNESQKSGMEPLRVKEFYHYCKNLGLNIIGLMCIPPVSKNVEEYFVEMNNLKKKISDNLLLSMGMSGDYPQAIQCGSNMIRIGSALFQ